MYQFYYANGSEVRDRPTYRKDLQSVFQVSAVRPAMWEEHCLECAAPACFGKCAHYSARTDGRCRRFENGIFVYPNEKGCCAEGARVKFRKWADMMTIIFPAMLDPDAYKEMTRKNRAVGERFRRIASSGLPVKVKWETIRTGEYIRRRALRSLTGIPNTPDAFVFHGYSFENAAFQLIIEIYKEHTSVDRISLNIEPGENLYVIDREKLSPACAENGFLVKVYPENDLEAELDILWCDFVKGKRIPAEAPADKVKCVVWDLDQTVWNGVLIETEDRDALTLNPGVLDTVKALDARGIIQSVASKNDYAEAWPVVEKLGIAPYFLYPQIHWNAKSGSLEQIAKRLNIGVDAIALVDDSDFERRQVSSTLPQVRVYDAAELGALLNRPEFDVPVTDESRSRRAMYKAEAKRFELMQAVDNGDTIAFLKKCNLRALLFEPQTAEEKLRCYELLIRTNQLNLSGKKYTPEEYEAVLKKPSHTCFAFSCEDDYGAYGVVGFGQYKKEDGKLCFTEFAMSCHEEEKYVESALFSFLLEAESCESGVFPVVKTKKNQLLRNTLQKIGFRPTEDVNGTVVYEFKRPLLNGDLVTVRTAAHRTI